MVKKVSSSVFISGKGSNLLTLIKNSQNSGFPLSIDLVVSNKKNALGLMHARRFNIPYKIYNSSNQKIFEKLALKILKKKKIKFLCLAGYMKILSPAFIKSFNNKIINIHPSLLPKYKGLNTHKKVLLNKENYSGCSVHYVTSILDSGKIILQKKIRIKKNETENSLQKKC